MEKNISFDSVKNNALRFVDDYLFKTDFSSIQTNKFNETDEILKLNNIKNYTIEQVKSLILLWDIRSVHSLILFSKKTQPKWIHNYQNYTIEYDETYKLIGKN